MNREVRDPYASWCERCTSASELAEAIYSIMCLLYFFLLNSGVHKLPVAPLPNFKTILFL